VVTLQAELELQKKLVADKDNDLALNEQRIEEMEEQMRSFTSLSGMD